MTADEWDRFVTDWPKVSDTDVYRQIPNLDDSTQAQLDSAFSRASYALMTVVKDLAEQSGQDIAAGDTDSKAMDMSKLGELVPMLAMLPQGMVDDAIGRCRRHAGKHAQPDGPPCSPKAFTCSLARIQTPCRQAISSAPAAKCC